MRTKKTQKTAFLVILLLCIIPLNNSFAKHNNSDINSIADFDPNYYNWSYQTTINIFPPPSVAEYQLKLELNTSNFDYSKANTSGQDIRFTDNSNISLPYYIEEWNPAGTSTLWVKILSAGTSFINMYCGNPLVDSESKGETTFAFFEDFQNPVINTTKWTISNDTYSQYNVTDGYLHLNVSTPNDYRPTACIALSDVEILHGQINGLHIDDAIGFGFLLDRAAATWESDVRTETKFYMPQQTWFESDIRWYNDSYVELENSTHTAVHTTNIPSIDMPLVLWTRAIYSGPGTSYGVSVSSTNYNVTSGYALKTYSWHHNGPNEGSPVDGGELKVEWLHVRKILDNEPIVEIGPMNLIIIAEFGTMNLITIVLSLLSIYAVAVIYHFFKKR